MKILRLLIPISAGLAMAVATLTAFAHGQAAPASPPAPPASETDLLPAGFAENIHADSSGKLWITEINSSTVREFDPATSAYTLYTGLGVPLDAQLGPDGKLWWIDVSNQSLARMDLGNRLVTTWPLSTTGAQALAFDGGGRVWVTNLLLIGLYSLDPANNQFCDVDLPDSGASETIVEHNGALWVGDTRNQRLGRITPTTDAYTYWSLAVFGGNPRPVDFTFAPNGEVWWADGGLGQVGRLEPDANRVTLFGPPGLSDPKQVAYHAGKVWLTDPLTGTIGFIDPAVAAGGPPQVVTTTATSVVSNCVTRLPAQPFTAGISTGVSTFSPLVITGTVDPEGTLYSMPNGGQPAGLQVLGFDLWATDVGRDKLVHLDTAAVHLYLPLIDR